MTTWPLTALNVSVYTAVESVPSVDATSSMAMVGVGSSSVIVPAPWASRIVAFVGLLRSNVYVSDASSNASLSMGTLTVVFGEPAVIVAVPDVVV